MKKKSRTLRIILLIVIAVLIIISALLAVGFISGKLYWEKDETGRTWLVVDNTHGKTTYEQNAEAMKTEYPTDLFVYGEDCHFKSFVPYITISEISSDAVRSDKPYKAIVINDMHGETPLADNDYQLLYQLVIKGEYSLAYIGKSKLNTFVEYGFIEDQFTGGDASFLIRNYNGSVKPSIGIWTDTEQGYYDNGSTDILGELLIDVFIKKLFK
ncbi:MAG: hypothetical protein MJ070_05115 [Lachnospiraceae bacterium]|nr:hypothetical protein [Lachnospiraceae bacterium]